MELKAYAKINLSLDITGLREDGYHLLKTVMQNIDLYDIVTVNKCEKGINLKCNKNIIPVDNRNLAYKAAELFVEFYGINEGVNIYIEKNIPIQAGLAGGSTDAAAVLKAMRDIFRPKVSNTELADMSLNLGADVPFCICGGTALCEGIGERVTPLKPFKDYIAVLVKPEFGVSTKDIYKDIDKRIILKHPNTENILEAIEKQNLQLLCNNMINVLEEVTVEKYTALNIIKEDIFKFKALGTLMSGSGSTIFGFFEDMLSAQKCYDYMKDRYNEVFITRTI
ncbi:4-diphosphocytidyl-2-C-methyl-D-erythritol kinase [Clostridium tetanomorphum]|uniref:4-diphosphocytidyl-2-C-methyl-D-erythritol kinase n=1 Tax=Clostridium tetanomorphum TaxID=1553 RepID=A0A923J301_CLOTT|nr:4-(cytidine 5'-diphospho)-2-C-methyl-D-erythritol kinase [Clostridium tetanomorphum]KAJ48895.1 4-diphosphocytidyl-2-C-methyl-D-erythritol kinase [Clostridium tetanomorphum DSM 665]KAJ53293.1 4-diphosphocytidyl-2-C-methyl-D-erythritol kinase [Clostridium tetanomorphum DSM 665]MBC2399413.1 4-(cytidine 5'-diphospho)-2-C-methyl-D-erythritol kinase [Clostridium tetanomorphum]MBP1865675.1 4-diphosphocytidyl-2-C-methyl-D-erythritol kinase [Clostridium tetanomorphum]NRS86795.1 4-diphosphocytidyl-2-